MDRPLCKCHGEPVYSNGACAVNGRARALARYAADPKKAAARKAELRAMNPDRVKEIARASYYKNREKRCATSRSWYDNNRERAIEATREWRAANPEKVLAYQTNRVVSGKLATQAWKRKARLAEARDIQLLQELRAQ
jgi:hypothetical protein